MYDIIGDVHGCFDEFLELVDRLGYVQRDSLYVHPENRQFVFVGDIADRGPKSIPKIKFVIQHVQANLALYVPGNHCNKLYRFLLGKQVQVTHGLETTVEEISKLTPEARETLTKQFISLYENAPYYLVLDQGQLIVSHAGIRQDYIGNKDKKVKAFCLYGDVTGETDDTGFPIRRDWAQDYYGDAWIVYGHTPVKEPRVVNRTVNIDTGCVFGGALTALRYPEFTYEQVISLQPYVAEKFRID